MSTFTELYASNAMATMLGTEKMAGDRAADAVTVGFTSEQVGNCFRGSKGTAVASGTTTDIGSVTGVFLHITGTTTITSFGTNGSDGALRWVVFDGALTLTHHATKIILPRATNITTAAGDIAVFAREGSDSWRMLNYVRADGTPLIRVEAIQVACSDETTDITAAANKITFRMPYAFTLTGVRASLSTAQASGSIFTVDINEGGTTILSTKLTIDNTEKTSTTAATPAVISDTALADDAEITVDVDQIGAAGARGLKVTLLGYRS